MIENILPTREKFAEFLSTIKKLRKQIHKLLGIGGLSEFQEMRLSEILVNERKCLLLREYRLTEPELIEAGKKLLEIADENEAARGKVVFAVALLGKHARTDSGKEEAAREELTGAEKAKKETQEKYDSVVDEFHELIKRAAELEIG
ncbi:MAG: hypothetical protein ABIE14_03845 [Patescibacteria group bacterium]